MQVMRCNASSTSWVFHQEEFWPGTTFYFYFSCRGAAALFRVCLKCQSFSPCLSGSAQTRCRENSQSRSFNQVPKLMTTGKGQNIKWQTKSYAISSLLTTTSWYNNCISANATKIHPSISCSDQPSFMNKTLRYLNSTWESNPSFSGWEPWPQIWRCWPSSPPLYPQLQESAGGHSPTRPSMQHIVK